jgi:beta-phosphoglucomutase
MTEQDKEAYCIKKNNLYVGYIQNLEQHEILPGVVEFITAARRVGLRIALGSASRNSTLILDRLGIRALFDVVVDGTIVHEAKPNPQVFLTAAAMLGLEADECIVFEDSIAGIEAAHNGGIVAVGIGLSDMLQIADAIVPGFETLAVDDVIRLVAHEKERT